MNTPSYVIGVDMGTTSTKAVLFTETGDVITQHAVEYPLYTPTVGAAEQDPEEIWTAVTTSVRTLIETSNIERSQLLCLSFGCAMHSLIAVGDQGQLLTKSITWADNRSAKWASQLKQNQKGHAIYRRTGTPIHAMSPLVKLIWLRNEHPEIFEQATKFISVKEYIFYRLFEQYLVDYSIASATGLMNLKELDWDKEALETAGITKHHLSQLVPTTHIVEKISESSALEWRIPVDTPIVMGASDGVLANLSVGAISPGSVTVTVGTSGAVRAVVEHPWTDPQERLFCYALTENHWVIGGAVNNGGIVFRWIRDQLGESEIVTLKELDQDPYELLTNLAQSVPPGADGLVFHPYLVGERAPIWDANARGSFVGLTLRHTKAHIIRAVLEGITYNLNLVLQALEDRIGKPKEIQVTGGLAKSYLWRQILADVFAQEITVPASYESTCLGAAVLGLYALNKIPTLDRVSQMLGLSEPQQPIQENVEIYRKVIPVYNRLLHLLQGEYANLAQLQDELK
ncbi:MAG TPA: gluconokinase [Coleofasciculaceae cyanobacterium]|jgi:gluconokinase